MVPKLQDLPEQGLTFFPGIIECTTLLGTSRSFIPQLAFKIVLGQIAESSALLQVFHYFPTGIDILDIFDVTLGSLF